MASNVLSAEPIATATPLVAEQLAFDLESASVYTPDNPRNWDQGVQTELPATSVVTKPAQSATEQYMQELEENRRDLADLALPGDPLSNFYRDDYSKQYDPSKTVDYISPEPDERADTLASKQELKDSQPVASVAKPNPFDSDKMLKKVLNSTAASRKADGRSKLSENNPAIKRLAMQRGISPRDVIEDAATTAIDRSHEARAEYERLTRVAEAIANFMPIAPGLARAKAPTVDDFVRSNFGTPQASKRNAALRRRIDSRTK